MNSNTTKIFRLSAGAGILLCTALAASAAGNSIVTFSVDMTGPIQNSQFTPGTSHVYVRGSFNNWSTGANYDGTGSSELTNNPSAANPNIYSGTFSDTNDANGAILNYKYYYNPGDAWESVNNRIWGLPTASGGTLTLPTYYFNDATPTGQAQVTNAITFRVDMTQQIVLGHFIPGTSHVFARGSFNNWGNDASATSPFPLTNNPAGPNTNLYTGTYYGPTGVEGGYVADHGSIQAYKYYIDTGDSWESPSAQSVDNSGNRRFNMLQADGTLVLPQVYFNDLPPIPPVTNFITFQVDMSVQAALGRFTPPPEGSDYVELRGSFNNWSTGIPLTNNPPPYTNKYSVVLGITNNPGTTISYKFWDNTFPGNYETPSSTGGNNRTVSLLATNGSFTIPDVYFSDQTLNSIVSTNTVVNFSVDMSNAVQYSTSTPFNPATDSVYINGDFLGWWNWRPTPDNLGPGSYQLTNNPTGPNPYIYSISLVIPPANALSLVYKYSIGGADNEAGFGQNHTRYVRTFVNSTLATDKFANMYTEPAWGQLSIGKAVSGQVPISWLGLPGVNLQTKTNLTSGSWVNLPATDGSAWTSGFIGVNGFTSTTNYPAASGQSYIRLVQPAAAPPAP